MQEAPKSKPKAVIHTEKRKVFVFNILFLFACFAVFAIATIFLTPDILFGLVFGLLAFYVSFAYETWRYFFITPQIDLHENGLDIRNFGFFDWSQCSYEDLGNELSIFTKWYPEQKLPRKKGKSGARVIHIDKKYNRLVIRFRMPKYLTNIPASEFCEKADCYKKGATAGHSSQAAKSAKLSWKYYAFGTEKPDRKKVIVTFVMLAIFALIFFKLFKMNFFPSEEWKGIINPVLVLVTVALFILTIWRVVIKKIRPNVPLSKSHAVLGILMGPFLIWGGLYLAFSLGIGHVYTIYAGAPFEVTDQVTVKKSSRSDGTCFEESAEFDTGIFSQLCFEYMDGLKKDTQLFGKFSGRESWMGRIVERFQSVTLSEVVQLAREAEDSRLVGLARIMVSDGNPETQKEGFEVARKAAESGDPEGQTFLASLYLAGKGTVKNETGAARWLSKAVEQNYPEAQFLLSHMLHNGWGVEKNENEASRLFREAVKNGHPEARYQLGKSLMTSNKPEDRYKAYAMLHLLRYDFKDSYSLQKKIYETFDKDQKREARRERRELRKADEERK